MNVMLAGALMFGSTIGLVPLQAHAAPSNVEDLVINEVNSSGGSDWVEIYHTGDTFNVGTDQLSKLAVEDADGQSYNLPASESLDAGGYLVVDMSNRLNNGGDAATLVYNGEETIDTISYGDAGSHAAPQPSETLSRLPNGTGDFAITNQPTQGSANQASNTATAPEADIHSLRMTVVQYSRYDGITVDFRTKNFSGAESLTVEILREDGTTVTKTLSGTVLESAVNDGADDSLTAPFPIVEGTYDASEDGAWITTPQNSEWNENTKPVKATVTIATPDGDETEFTETLINGNDYESILPPAPVAVTPYSNGFETDTSGWLGDITRVASENGVAASGGNYYAHTGTSYTGWGHPYANVFPEEGYTTEVDVYLDMDKSDGASSKHFDFSSAINNPKGEHRRDFIFHVGTNPNVPGQWSASASNNANASAPLHLQNNPVAVTKTGWYIMQSYFHENSSGQLVVTMNLVNTNNGSVVGTWTLDKDNDIIGENVGGSRYGWFVNQPFADLAIDNSRLYLGQPVSRELPDTKAPVAKITSPTNGGAVNGEINVIGEVADDNPMNSYFEITGPNSYKTKSKHTDGRAEHEFKWDTTGLNNGEYKIQFETRDQAGNKDSGSVDVIYVTVDNHAPNYTVKSGKDFTVGSTENDAYRKVSFKLSDNHNIDKVTINGVEKDLSNSKWSEVNYVQPGRYGAAEGANTLVVYDVAGNTTTYEFTLDTQNPEAEITSPTDGKFLRGAVSVKITATDENLAAYSYRIKNLSTGEKPVDQVVVSSNGPTNQEVFSWNTKDSADGEYYVYVSARDKAGNRDEQRIYVTVDNTGPETPELVSPANGIPVQGDDLVNDWQGDDADTAHYVYQSFNVNADGSCNLNDMRWEQAYTDSQTNSRDVGDLTYCWRVKAVDSLGNESDWSEVWKAVVDNTAPVINTPVTFEDGTSAEDATVSGTVTFNVTQTEENPRKLYVEYMKKDKDGDWQKLVGQEFRETNEALFTVNTTEWEDGEYQVKISTDDMAWNSDGHSFLVYADNTPEEEAETDENGEEARQTGDSQTETGTSGVTNSSNEPTDPAVNFAFTGNPVFAQNSGVLGANGGDGVVDDGQQQNGDEDNNEDTISLNTDEGSGNSNNSDVAGAASNNISNWWWLLAVLLAAGAIYVVYRKAQTNETN